MRKAGVLKAVSGSEVGEDGQDTAVAALTSAFTRWTMIWSLQVPKGVTSMPTYVSLINWTDQGIKNYKDSPSRAADFIKLAESSGGRVRELLWTVGEYDLVTVVDFPDDQTATAALLQVGSLGSIRSNTMRAFSADEMTTIIGKTG
jgi:uncharacterized protein with GYD domain